jgi:3D (Asp-Asp-Asp) domain-containing protein
MDYCRVRARWRGVALLLALVSAACGGRTARRPQPSPGTPIFTVTAYCQRGITASGVPVREGIVAADPSQLPIGTLIRVSGLAARYNGDYRVMDTGSGVRGRHIDLYIRDCREAIAFGRREATVTIRRRAVR